MDSATVPTFVPLLQNDKNRRTIIGPPRSEPCNTRRATCSRRSGTRSCWKSRPASFRLAKASLDQIAEVGWASEIDLEEAFYPLDRRLEWLGGLFPCALVDVLKLPWRVAFPHPKREFDEIVGYPSLSAIDAANLLILIERLGFRIEVGDFFQRLAEPLLAAPKLSHEELAVRFYHQARHRGPPLTLSTDERQWRGWNRRRLKTELGYRVELVVADDRAPLYLTVHSPKYRKRSGPAERHCSQCGMTYWAGVREEVENHRRLHRQRLSALEPKPHREVLRARERGGLPARVDWRSGKWKHREMYIRATAFKHEMGYDFIQWRLEPRENGGAESYLFIDDAGAIVGACSFQPEDNNTSGWRLDWVRICPGKRRSGVLSRHWPVLRQYYGDFYVEPPVSPAMRAFLEKRGETRLLTPVAASQVFPSPTPLIERSPA